jgi:hypothetical protein
MPLNNGRQVDLKGTVTDTNPASVALTFTGVASGTTTADATGRFDFVAQASGLGTVDAVAQDGQKSTSNTATATFAVTPPSLTLTISYGSQRTVTLSGRVTGPAVGSLTVTFTGVVTGSTTTKADGTFTLTTQASALGNVQATAADVWGQSSSAVQVTVASAKPVLSNFTASEQSDVWTFQGQVTAPSPQGETVQFTEAGVPSLQTKTATVDSSGWFFLQVTLQDNENGKVWAQATDCWGQTSNQPMWLISQTT